MSNYKLFAILPILTLLSFYLTINHVYATSDWDFTGKNQPHAESLAKFDRQYFELSCADRHDVMYENYARMHPAFRQYLGDLQMRKKWRIAMIVGTKPNRDSFNHCFYRSLRRQWSDAIYTSQKHSLIFCGKIVEGLNGFDQYAADALAEMTLYAITGRPQAILTLLGGLEDSDRAHLNIDLAYYLQRHLQFFLNQKPPPLEELAIYYRRWLKPDAGLDLDPTRKEILDIAYAKGDHLKVLKMTAPCQGT